MLKGASRRIHFGVWINNRFWALCRWINARYKVEDWSQVTCSRCRARGKGGPQS